MTYRSCPYHARLRYLERIPQPESPPDAPNMRGLRLHDSSEHFIRDGAPLCKELLPLEEQYNALITARASGQIQVEAEQRDYFDANWQPCEKGDHWLIVIKDIAVTGAMNLTIDLKSGRKFGNEVKHFGQVQLYAVTEWIKDSGYQEYTAELWYPDVKEIVTHVFTEPKLEQARANLDLEVSVMMKDRIHQPRPNKVTCRYCPYSPRGNGYCPVGV